MRFTPHTLVSKMQEEKSTDGRPGDAEVGGRSAHAARTLFEGDARVRCAHAAADDQPYGARAPARPAAQPATHTRESDPHPNKFGDQKRKERAESATAPLPFARCLGGTSAISPSICLPPVACPDVVDLVNIRRHPV